MEKINHLKHTKETLFFCISRLLEKTSYYGLRSILLLYLLSDALKMSETNALTVYGWFASSFVISQIIGAIFGDLLIGNKKAIIVGGIIQALGCFFLCIPSTIGLYTGLSLVVFGNGLYTPNLIASFGKSYLNKTKLLHSGFTLFRLMVNIGAFLGTILISFISVKFNFTFGFILTGILMLLSIIPILISEAYLLFLGQILI
jgi:POT family proton-dependent oligopeptide transporter